METTGAASTVSLTVQLLLMIPVLAVTAVGIRILLVPVSGFVLAPFRRWLPEDFDLEEIRPKIVGSGVLGAAAGWLALVFLF